MVYKRGSHIQIGYDNHKRNPAVGIYKSKKFGNKNGITEGINQNIYCFAAMKEFILGD
ncbi:hypothetical protein J2128_000270 [Methanomicrobium sp. W14]|nr:hypothetical protein [Methanomicrobium sp. W14]